MDPVEEDGLDNELERDGVFTLALDDFVNEPDEDGRFPRELMDVEEEVLFNELVIEGVLALVEFNGALVNEFIDEEEETFDKGLTEEEE